MVDYSKWKNIEISDDEDDTHPNIDTPSLFRWRHQARLERMADFDNEKEELLKAKQSHQARLIEAKQRMESHKDNQDELEKLEVEGINLNRREEELMKKEKRMPWNVDTISKPGFEKTMLNKQPERKNDENLTEEEREQKMKDFIKENEKLCKEYGMLRKYDDSKRFLQQHSQLVCDETANYLVIWSINLEMEKKHDLMSHVAHQCICMQYILELAKQLNVDPRACVVSFFSKIQNCVPEYRTQFENEIEAFKERISKRAEEKIQEAIAEAEEEKRQARLGPGGLDPVEVFEELPDELKKCFETRDTELLQKTIADMPVDLAKYHMKRCVDSGLWVPNASDNEGDDTGDGIEGVEGAEASETGDDGGVSDDVKQKAENKSANEAESKKTDISIEDLD